MVKIDTILVPTDFSEHADKALAYAIEFARKSRRRASKA